MNTPSSSIQVTVTDTLKVDYASMPITDLSLSYLVQIVEPMRLNPEIITIKMLHSADDIKRVMLDKWQSLFINKDVGLVPDWMTDIKNVTIQKRELFGAKINT